MGRWSTYGFGVSYRFNVKNDYARMLPVLKTINNEYDGNAVVYLYEAYNEDCRVNIGPIDCKSEGQFTCFDLFGEQIYSEDDSENNLLPDIDWILYFRLNDHDPGDNGESTKLTKSGFSLKEMTNELTQITNIMKTCGIDSDDLNVEHYSSEWA
jgi:hypothetical protein